MWICICISEADSYFFTIWFLCVTSTITKYREKCGNRVSKFMISFRVLWWKVSQCETKSWMGEKPCLGVDPCHLRFKYKLRSWWESLLQFWLQLWACFFLDWSWCHSSHPLAPACPLQPLPPPCYAPHLWHCLPSAMALAPFQPRALNTWYLQPQLSHAPVIAVVAALVPGHWCCCHHHHCCAAGLGPELPYPPCLGWNGKCLEGQGWLWRQASGAQAPQEG